MTKTGAPRRARTNTEGPTNAERNRTAGKTNSTPPGRAAAHGCSFLRLRQRRCRRSSARVQDVARLRLAQRHHITCGAVLGARGAADAVAGGAVAVAGQSGAIQTDAGRGTAPDIRDAELRLGDAERRRIGNAAAGRGTAAGVAARRGSAGGRPAAGRGAAGGRKSARSDPPELPPDEELPEALPPLDEGRRRPAGIAAEEEPACCSVRCCAWNLAASSAALASAAASCSCLTRAATSASRESTSA